LIEALVVDLTHGGVTIAIELEKLGYFSQVYAYDLYQTLKHVDIEKLLFYNIKIIKNLSDINANNINNLENEIKNSNLEEEIKNNLKDRINNNFQKKELLISSPIHSSLKADEIRKETNHSSGLNLTHHETVEFILKDWKKENEKVNIIEVTGVKGKTTTVLLLKSIFKEYNPLVLSSLGASLTINNDEIILKKNISITPASILETIRLANELNKSLGKVNKPLGKTNLTIKNQKSKKQGYGIAIFENSLGTSGIATVGVLTNIIENYKIAKNSSNAKIAKEQVFNSEHVVIDYDTLIKFYPEKVDNDLNTFKLENYNLYDDEIDKIVSFKLKSDSFNLNKFKPNLIAKKVKYDLVESEIEIEYNDIKTIHGNTFNGKLTVNVFAPGKYHVLNVLAGITTALTLEIDENIIKQGLKDFKPVYGRSSIRFKGDFKIIEEINPGINVKSIEKAIEMIKNLDNYSLIIGGKYGITCEEIDEFKLSNFLDIVLDKYDLDLTLVDELGRSVADKMNQNVNFIEDYIRAQDIAIEKQKNILFIYRSNYSQITKR
jgi:UDP-N-acetylmuramyl pentapeptide synthase